MINLPCFWPVRFAFGVVYVASMIAARQLALALEPRRGRIVEDPDELGFYWEWENDGDDG